MPTFKLLLVGLNLCGLAITNIMMLKLILTFRFCFVLFCMKIGCNLEKKVLLDNKKTFLVLSATSVNTFLDNVQFRVLQEEE